MTERILSQVIILVMVFLNFSPLPASAQDCTGKAISLDWSNLDWPRGKRHAVFQIDHPDDGSPISLAIDISTKHQGSFTAFDVQSPYLDGVDIVNFGNSVDLGIMFDPEPNQGSSPITIKVRFDRPVQCASFEISDIDIASGRVDSVVVFGNNGNIQPHLLIASSTPTVKLVGNAAVGIPASGSRVDARSAFAHEDYGNPRVSFGSELLDSITIIYYEGSNEINPSARGIGVFGDLSFYPATLLPATLLKFGVALDEACQPVVRWLTDQEFALDEYVIEYSYDGYNFFHAASTPALNQYTSRSEYEVPLYRRLNVDNFFRLVKIKQDGTKEILTTQSLSGAECFQFSSVNVYPNPSSGNYVFIEIESTGNKQTQIAIIDQYGELLVQTQYPLKKGQNIFKLESRYLIPGIYNLRFSIDGEVVTKRVSILD